MPRGREDELGRDWGFAQLRADCEGFTIGGSRTRVVVRGAERFGRCRPGPFDSGPLDWFLVQILPDLAGTSHAQHRDSEGRRVVDS